MQNVQNIYYSCHFLRTRHKNPKRNQKLKLYLRKEKQDVLKHQKLGVCITHDDLKGNPSKAHHLLSLEHRFNCHQIQNIMLDSKSFLSNSDFSTIRSFPV